MASYFETQVSKMYFMFFPEAIFVFGRKAVKYRIGTSNTATAYGKLIAYKIILNQNSVHRSGLFQLIEHTT
jgi:hypothetical protein